MFQGRDSRLKIYRDKKIVYREIKNLAIEKITWRNSSEQTLNAFATEHYIAFSSLREHFGTSALIQAKLPDLQY